MMEAKDYDYIRYDPGVLDWEFESPLDGLSREEQLNHGRAVVDDVVQSFGPFARPVEAEFNIIDEESGEEHKSTTKSIYNNSGISSDTIQSTIDRLADNATVPQFGGVTLSSEALLTLSNGKRYVFTPETSDEFRYEREYPHSRPVIKIHIRQHGVQKPFHSSMVTVETHTDHWMVPVGDAQDVTKFTQINQQRLTSALWELHGRLNPQPFSIERWEDSDGHFRGMVGPNETPAILEKHRVEWVTRNFEWTQPDESTFEFEYVGDQPFDLVNGPHMFPKYYLELTLPDVEYDKLETVVVDLPDSRWKADLIGSSTDWTEQS